MRMIYTITTNPSLDYYMELNKKIEYKTHNRSTFESFDAGGKGVTVGKYLNNLGIQSTALGFLGGFVKDYYLDKLKRYTHIQPLFTTISDTSRINIKIIADDELSLNAKGPTITDEEFKKFYERTSRIYDSDSIVFSGNIQDNLKDKMISLIKELSENGSKIILDTNMIVMEKCLQYMPYIVKINDRSTSCVEKEIIEIGKKMCEKGAHNVLYSSQVYPEYYMISKDYVYKAIRDNTEKRIGTGDSLIAGFLYSRLHGANHLESFKYAVASTTKLSLEVKEIDRNEFDKYASSIEVEEIK